GSPAQLSRFLLGPWPCGTLSSSANSAAPAVKTAAWVPLQPSSCPPAPAAPPRTPGSVALNCVPPPPKDSREETKSTWKKDSAATDPANDSGTASVLFITAYSNSAM